MSIEYAAVTVKPVVPNELVTDPTLKSVFAGMGSVTMRLEALAVPLFVKAIV